MDDLGGDVQGGGAEEEVGMGCSAVDQLDVP